MSQQPIRNALKQTTGYGVKKLGIALIYFPIILNAIVSAISGFIASGSDAWKPFVAVPITAVVVFAAGTIAAIKLAIGSTLLHGVEKADLVRVTVNAILECFVIDPNLGLTRSEFDRQLGQVVQGLRAQAATDGKLSWVAEKARNRILNLSTLGIARFADSAFKEHERVSLQTFRDTAADSVNRKISAAIQSGVVTACSAILVVAVVVTLGFSFLLRIL